jgi:hypothetical protein
MGNLGFGAHPLHNGLARPDAALLVFTFEDRASDNHACPFQYGKRAIDVFCIDAGLLAEEGSLA